MNMMNNLSSALFQCLGGGFTQRMAASVLLCASIQSRAR